MIEMPKYYKKRRRTRKKKSYKKRRRTYSRKYAPVPSGMPLQRRATLRYCDQFSLTSTAGAFGGYVFSANGLHDPNITGTGHQPMGWDQWKLLFNHYVTVGSKITVRFTASEATNTNPAKVGVYLTDSTTIPYTTWQEFQEARKGTQRTVQGGIRTAPTVTSRFSAKSFYNLTNIKDNTDRLGSQVDANPTEQALYAIWFQTLNASTVTLNATVQVDYIVDFSEPRDLTQS